MHSPLHGKSDANFHSQMLEVKFLIPFTIPKVGNINCSFPFPFPKVGKRLGHFPFPIPIVKFSFPFMPVPLSRRPSVYVHLLDLYRVERPDGGVPPALLPDAWLGADATLYQSVLQENLTFCIYLQRRRLLLLNDCKKNALKVSSKLSVISFTFVGKKSPTEGLGGWILVLEGGGIVKI